MNGVCSAGRFAIMGAVNPEFRKILAIGNTAGKLYDPFAAKWRQHGIIKGGRRLKVIGATET